MGQRILTDGEGRRWDVADDDGGLRFNHPPDGPSYRAPSEKNVDQLRDEDLILLLDQARQKEGDEPVGRGTGGEGAPGGDY